MKRPPLHKKYASTFFIFPVFLPLMEFLPLLLTLIAALATFVQILSKSLWQDKRNRIITLSVIAASLLAAALLVGQRIIYTPSAAEGSELVPASAYSTLETLPPSPSSAMPADNEPFSLRWKSEALNQNIARPAIHGSMLMVGTYQGTLDAYTITTGKALWSLHKHEQVFTTPVFAGDKGFVGEGHHTSPASVMTAFAVPEGKPLWERKFRSHLESSPVPDAANNRVWMAGGDVGLWALNMENGESLWWSAIGHSDIPPLFENGRLFAAASTKESSGSSALFELNPDSGKILRSTSLPGNPMCNILSASDGGFLLGTAIGQVGVKRETDAGWAHGFDADGKLRWTVKLPAMPLPEGIMLKDKSLLFYTLNNGYLIALNPLDGRIVWQVAIGTAFQTDATLSQEGKIPLVIAVTSEGYVTIREARTGKEVTHFSIEKGDSYPLYHEGMLYISTPYNLYAYKGVKQ